jgi:RNase P subunit RPR2
VAQVRTNRFQSHRCMNCERPLRIEMTTEGTLRQDSSYAFWGVGVLCRRCAQKKAYDMVKVPIQAANVTLYSTDNTEIPIEPVQYIEVNYEAYFKGYWKEKDVKDFG